MTPKPKMVEDFDFVGGILAALVGHGKTHFRLNERTHDRLDLAFELSMEEAFEHLRELLQDADIEIGFRVRTHPLHGDSQTVRQALTFLTSLRLIRGDGPGFVTQFDEGSTATTFDMNPVKREIYELLAREFTLNYYAPRTERPHAHQMTPNQEGTRYALRSVTTYA